ncbi:DUF2637 domain-containing protein [Streptomyces avicenniae]|uniref:DUF2637 domain-containing protein n=1 Tax=Streptomyces avicenniae TaxID=500153 RepID=UPI000A78F3CB|nr:DUF2637 domain-containing protein [Streptomyces avicenniae]
MAAIKLTRAHRILVGIVMAGAVVIAAIGFAGSYASVRDLAERKGFGAFSPFFPIGVDAGIVVLLALDLLLTWLRIPFPMLRQSAWLLTAATIAFNGAAAWGDPLAVGMHAIIPLLFVITVEAARHAIGRIADITADKHMEGVRVWRWFLSPLPTFRLWRRMKLWELRSYEEVIGMERDRLVYQARLRADYGRGWRRRAPVEARMPLKLARYGVPLHETAPVGLAAAGLPPAAAVEREALPAGGAGVPQQRTYGPPVPHAQAAPAEPAPTPADAPAPAPAPVEEGGPGEPWWVDNQPPVAVPVGSGGRTRPLGSVPVNGRAQYYRPAAGPEAEPVERRPEHVVAQERFEQPAPPPVAQPEAQEPATEPAPATTADVELYYTAYRQYALENGEFPNARLLSRFLNERFSVTDERGALLSEQYLREFTRGFKERYSGEMGTGV